MDASLLSISVAHDIQMILSFFCLVFFKLVTSKHFIYSSPSPYQIYSFNIEPVYCTNKVTELILPSN